MRPDKPRQTDAVACRRIQLQQLLREAAAAAGDDDAAAVNNFS